MGSKYEQKINQMAETLARMDERSIGLSNRLYDKDGDIPEIREHLEKMNGQIERNTSDIQSSPIKFLGKKWFWIVVAIVILSVLGLSVTDIKAIAGLLTGI